MRPLDGGDRPPRSARAPTRPNKNTRLWWTAIVGLIVVSAASITGLYRTPAELETYGRLVRGNSALIVQSGPGYGLDNPTTGAVMINESSHLDDHRGRAHVRVHDHPAHTHRGGVGTRRADPGGARRGRHAPLAAALIGVAIADALVAIGSAVALIGYGLPVWGSFAFGMSIFGAGLVFAGVAAVAAQVASGSRAALGAGWCRARRVVRPQSGRRRGQRCPVVGVAHRMAHGSSPSPTSGGGCSPSHSSRRLVCLPAVALQDRRDSGAGLIEQRPGPTVAGSRPSSPSRRPSVSNSPRWSAAIGVGLISFFNGIVADQAESMIQDNPDLADSSRNWAGRHSPTRSCSVGAHPRAHRNGLHDLLVLRLRSEELAGRPMRSSPPRDPSAARARHLTVAVVGTVVIMVVAGLSIGLGFALVSGDASHRADVAASVVMVPRCSWSAASASPWFTDTGGDRWRSGGDRVGHGLPECWPRCSVSPDWTLDLFAVPARPALPAGSMSWLPVIALLLSPPAWSRSAWMLPSTAATVLSRFGSGRGHGVETRGTIGGWEPC